MLLLVLLLLVLLVLLLLLLSCRAPAIACGTFEVGVGSRRQTLAKSRLHRPSGWTHGHGMAAAAAGLLLL